MGAAGAVAAIEAWLAPRVRPKRRVLLERSDAPMAATASRFGGVPYMEAGETWPMCVCGLPLSFICQLDLRGTPVHEPGGLVAFYYCWECFPQDPEPGPWALRVYADPRDERAITVAQPAGARVTARCAVRYEEARSVPVWDSDEADAPELREMARAANDDAPWEPYQEACERVAGPQELETAVGGYPHWLQGNEAPDDGRLIATIDSEDAADIMWGDCGLVFIYLTSRGPHLILQSL